MDETVRIEPRSLEFSPMKLITQKMSNEAMYIRPAAFFIFSNHFKTQEMCIKAVEEYPWDLGNVPDHSRTQKICKKVVSEDPYSLQYLSDWFVLWQQAKIWHEDVDSDDNYELITWCNGFKKRIVLQNQTDRKFFFFFFFK